MKAIILLLNLVGLGISDRSIKSHRDGPRIVSNIPGIATTSPSIAQFISSKYGFDGPKVSPINATAVDWWYFDSLSADGKSSFVITFLMQPSIIDRTHVLLVNFVANFPNGTSTTASALASSAVVVTHGQGSSGQFIGTGANWTGAPNMNFYEVLIDSPVMGINGKMTLRSVSQHLIPILR